MAEETESDEKVNQLTMLEQSMQNTVMQKQNFHLQLLELESALKEIQKAPEAYKIVANVMIRADRDELMKDLSEKKEMIELRIKSLEKQESKLKEKAAEIQKDVLGQLEGSK